MLSFVCFWWDSWTIYTDKCVKVKSGSFSKTKEPKTLPRRHRPLGKGTQASHTIPKLRDQAFVTTPNLPLPLLSSINCIRDGDGRVVRELDWQFIRGSNHLFQSSLTVPFALNRSIIRPGCFGKINKECYRITMWGENRFAMAWSLQASQPFNPQKRFFRNQTPKPKRA